MTRNVVQVTQQFIDQGHPQEPNACPIALSLANWNNHHWVVSPGLAFDSTGNDNWDLDDAVENWIYEFDLGELVYPIGLVMDTESLPLTIRLQDSAEPTS